MTPVPAISHRLLASLLAFTEGCSGTPAAAVRTSVTASRGSAPTSEQAAERPRAAPDASDARGSSEPTRSTQVPPVPEPPAAPDAPPAARAHVEIKYIGLHVGGGPNDRATKAPFERALARHFPDLATCYAGVEEPGASGTFGIDLLVPASGGHARASHPRTALGGDAFRGCVVRVFESVDFEKPRLGPARISYSVRFDGAAG